MTTISAGAAPGRLAQALAVLSVVCCCLLPIGPLVAIGAVALTRGTTGWPRRCALVGAALSVATTLILAVAVAVLTVRTLLAAGMPT